MSQEIAIINEEALQSVSSSIKLYISQYKQAIEDSITKIQQNSGDWNDEDFNMLLSAINSFMTDISNAEVQSNKLIRRINEKIDDIHRLHNMNI